MPATASPLDCGAGFGAVLEFLSCGENPLVERIADIIELNGGAAAINERARQAGRVDNLLERMREEKSKYLGDVQWIIEQRDARKFVGLREFAAGAGAHPTALDAAASKQAVTLEISWLQVFPCLITQLKQAIAQRELLPGRYILGKDMKEQDLNGGLLATTAALNVMGVSFVDMLDTNGAADGSNVHLGGAQTLAGYFGGIGQPNDLPLVWIEEYLHYYTRYGVRQVLNINYGTVLAGYILHNLGVDIQFKLSVFLGNDNPYSVAMNLLLARMFSRPDGSTPIVGLNFANSINNTSIVQCARLREALGLSEQVRFEHHILQDRIGMVRQPFDRREELIELARSVTNISAKHEGGEVAVENSREEPSTVFDLFLGEDEIYAKGMLPRVTRAYLDKHDAINNTARALLKNGIPVIPAPSLHSY